MATVDLPEHAADVAKDIADCVRRGFAIEHVTVGYVRTNWSTHCECKQANKARTGRAETSRQPALF
jgi:hypothetical protein